MADQPIEQALLGSILLKPSIMKDILVSSEDFEDPLNRKIYQAMGEFDADGVAIEIRLISEKLKDPKIIPYLLNLHDQTLTHMAYKEIDTMLRGRSAKRKAEQLSQIILKMSQNGSSPEAILEKSQELTRIISEKLQGRQTLAVRIDDYLSRNMGNVFFVTELDKELGIVTERDKDNRRQIILRLQKKARIVRASNRQGHFRVVDNTVEVIDFKKVKSTEAFDILWPFDLQKYVKVLPKNIVVVAGYWEAGKTAFLLNVVYMNMKNHRIRYISSEMGEEELRTRLDLFTEIAPEDWNFEAIDESMNIEDKILPDAVNIIDYLEVSDNFYQVGEKIRRIYDKLKRGIAIIGLQKDSASDLGRGKDFSAEKARLYLSLNPGELTIVKGKLWANPQMNPRNTTFEFDLVAGHKFHLIGQPYKKDKKKDEKQTASRNQGPSHQNRM